MKRFIITATLVALSFSASLHAQTTKSVSDLPDISVIGNFLGTHTKNKTSFDVNELEFSFQHYLYPSVKADIFTAAHKNAEGSHSFEIEEAYVTFSDVFGVAFPNYTRSLGIGAVVGKKLIGAGKVNPLHPEQWQFVDRPLATQQFLGGTEGLSAEGAQLSYLLPTPFFSQIELGYWTVASHEEDDHAEEESHGVEYSNRLFNGRLWNSFNLSETQELELGLSYVQGNASASSKTDKQDLMGIDLTLTKELGSEKSLTLQSEYYQATYGEDGEERETQSGGFLSGFFKLNPYYQMGLRVGTLGKHGSEGNTQQQWAWILTRQLTETSKFRLQYNTGDNVENTLYAQFIFGMGPHSHVLQ